MTRKKPRATAPPRPAPPMLDIPRTDGLPSRPYTSVNARFEEKRAFDHLHSWWRLQGEALDQIDAFSRVLALALEHPSANAPPDLLRYVKKEDGREE